MLIASIHDIFGLCCEAAHTLKINRRNLTLAVYERGLRSPHGRSDLPDRKMRNPDAALCIRFAPARFAISQNAKRSNGINVIWVVQRGCRVITGATAVNTRVHLALLTSHMRLPVHWAPDVPHALRPGGSRISGTSPGAPRRRAFRRVRSWCARGKSNGPIQAS